MVMYVNITKLAVIACRAQRDTKRPLLKDTTFHHTVIPLFIMALHSAKAL